MRKLFFGIGFLFLMIFFVPAARADYAKFMIEAPSQITAGSFVFVKVLFSDDVPVNAYSLRILYPATSLAFVDSNDGNVIDIWQNKSVLTPGVISLSGGSTAPFNGENGELVTLRFRAIKTEKPIITASAVQAYLADGRGTAISPVVAYAELANGSTPLAEKSDRTPPKIAFLGITQDPFNPEQKLLSFSVTAPTGIKSSEVRSRSWLFWSDWTMVSNPALISNTAWSVEFRTVDNAGNTADRVIYNWGAIGIFIAELGTALVAVWLLLRFFHRTY